ncbi:unnamed protein product [Cuscuta campestris]|uniref:Uncharacterized protein n=1 Tax=Cuscuta campestris TaxID=132261 RepID=A0A484KB69_9ASTE|nr:unnamed protein product [Cuscuta campestris]
MLPQFPRPLSPRRFPAVPPRLPPPLQIPEVHHHVEMENVNGGGSFRRGAFRVPQRRNEGSWWKKIFSSKRKQRPPAIPPATPEGVNLPEDDERFKEVDEARKKMVDQNKNLRRTMKARLGRRDYSVGVAMLDEDDRLSALGGGGGGGGGGRPVDRDVTTIEWRVYAVLKANRQVEEPLGGYRLDFILMSIWLFFLGVLLLMVPLGIGGVEDFGFVPPSSFSEASLASRSFPISSSTLNLLPMFFCFLHVKI